MIDDSVVKTKEAAADKIAVESLTKYEILKGSDIMTGQGFRSIGLEKMKGLVL